MPSYSIRTTNSTFVANDDDTAFVSPESALESGIQGAVQITADEIASGKLSAAVEVCVSDGSGAALLRSVVALSVSPLLIDKSSVVPLFA